jgi:hypothetical protein
MEGNVNIRFSFRGKSAGVIGGPKEKSKNMSKWGKFNRTLNNVGDHGTNKCAFILTVLVLSEHTAHG